ncbi:MAG TPA: hypothetical protein VJS92_09465, partial [Candidatus Polarisedimenticolaceae bacterium]|nr:hypothetical protein [Candidatus Polarisedimenticolaceae bacterium]
MSADDYLDDRLSPAERAELEARLARDPELAAQIEAYREQRRALRAEDVAPSEEFYRTARRRFERARPAGARRVRWTTVGALATAALLALVLVPRWMRREVEIAAPPRPEPAPTAP